MIKGGSSRPWTKMDYRFALVLSLLALLLIVLLFLMNCSPLTSVENFTICNVNNVAGIDTGCYEHWDNGKVFSDSILCYAEAGYCIDFPMQDNVLIVCKGIGYVTHHGEALVL